MRSIVCGGPLFVAALPKSGCLFSHRHASKASISQRRPPTHETVDMRAPKRGAEGSECNPCRSQHHRTAYTSTGDLLVLHVNDSRERAHPEGFARGTLLAAAEASLVTASPHLGCAFVGLAPLPTSEFDAASLALTSRCISSFCCSKSSSSSRRACGPAGEWKRIVKESREHAREGLSGCVSQDCAWVHHDGMCESRLCMGPS